MGTVLTMGDLAELGLTRKQRRARPTRTRQTMTPEERQARIRTQQATTREPYTLPAKRMKHRGMMTESSTLGLFADAEPTETIAVEPYSNRPKDVRGRKMYMPPTSPASVERGFTVSDRKSYEYEPARTRMTHIPEDMVFFNVPAEVMEVSKEEEEAGKYRSISGMGSFISDLLSKGLPKTLSSSLTNAVSNLVNQGVPQPKAIDTVATQATQQITLPPPAPTTPTISSVPTAPKGFSFSSIPTPVYIGGGILIAGLIVMTLMKRKSA